MAEAIRIRMNAGQAQAALGEAAKLAAPGAREGAAANLLAAQLYLEQGKADLADQVIEQVAKRARSREERRQVALAREQGLLRSGQAAKLSALYTEWKKSDDPCLRMAAAQREQQQKMTAGLMESAPGSSSP